MSMTLPPAPIRSPITDTKGNIQAPWLQWFRILFERVGGAGSMSNDELALFGAIDDDGASTQAAMQAEIDGLKQQVAQLTATLESFVDLAPHEEIVQNKREAEDQQLEPIVDVGGIEKRLMEVELAALAPARNEHTPNYFPFNYPTKNPRSNGSWVDLWVPDQQTFVDNVLSLRNQSKDAGGTIYGLAAICCLDGAGSERGAFGYSRNSAIQPAGYTPDIVYVEFGDPFTGDANPSSFQLICTMAGSSAWFPGTTFVAMEHVTKTGATIIRARGGQPISLSGGYTLTEDLSVGYKGNVKQALGGMTNTCWRIRERDNTDSAAWTTNINDSGTQDDATKSSWKVKIGYGNTDDSFKIERAPAGSSVFTNFLKVTNAGKFGINTTTIGEFMTVFTGSDEYAYSWQKTGAKKWVLGSYVGGSYLTNATDGRKHIQNLDTGETLIFGGGAEGMRIDTSKNAVFKGSITHADSTLIKTSVALSDNSGTATGTLTNAPLAGNPTKWIAIDDNGTIRRIPAW